MIHKVDIEKNTKQNCVEIVKRLCVFENIKKITIVGIAIVSFSYFMVQLFGQIIPSTVLAFFKELSFAIVIAVVIAAVFIFAVTWFARAIPRHRPKNYSIVYYDVFGTKSNIDGLRTEFKNHDVAWSFMKQYKDQYPMHNFALVCDFSKSDKKTIIRYL